MNRFTAIAITTFIFTSFATTTRADTLFVDTDASTSGNGNSWSTAYKYLQDAMYDAAGDPAVTEIRVAGGTYYPDEDEASIVTPDDPEAAFTIVLHDSPNQHDIALRGGYRGQSGLPGGTENTRDETTTLSGDIDDVCDGDCDSWTILFAPLTGKPGAVTIDGFTFSDGYAGGPGTGGLHETHGAAVFVNGGYGGNLTIKDCVFELNYADGGGGAVYVANRASSVIVTGCLFDENEGHSGGAMGITDCNALQIGGDQTGEGCVFEDNEAYQGGAINTQNTPAMIEYCDFDRNVAVGNGAVGGAIDAFSCGTNSDTFDVDHCTFDANIVNDTGANGYGGAIAIKGYRGAGASGHSATFTHCDFTNNRSTLHAAALWLYSEDLEPSGTCYLGPVLVDTCQFIDNLCDYDQSTGLGGAIWSRNIELTCIDSTFDGNEAEKGGGAIWFEAFLLGNSSEAELIMDGCTFIGNAGTTTDATQGGGAVFIEGMKDGSEETTLTGSITDCDFIGNSAIRGGGVYIHSATDLEIGECRFIANTTTAAGGGIGIGDPHGIEETEVRICKSQFISNTSVKGGAVHNHEGAITYMVNCHIAGNTSTQEGGGVFNSRHTGNGLAAQIFMHNCIIAGNVADGTGTLDMGGGIFNGLNVQGYTNDIGLAELIHCTVIGNRAGWQYGGVANNSENSDVKLRNTIVWDNVDADTGTDNLSAQVFYAPNSLGMDDDDFVDNNVIDQLNLDDDRFDVSGQEVNTHLDPVFVDEGATTIEWTAYSYNASNGVTTFTCDDEVQESIEGMLFRPDPNKAIMLLIIAVDETNDLLYCHGKWSGIMPQNPMSGKLFDLHVDGSGSAEDFGDTDHVPLDYCDLNGENGATDKLPFDLGLETREVNDPDCGVYEIPAP